MAIAKITGAQIDFSAGELDESIKRAHDSIQKIGARQMANWRILSSKLLQNRPGRSALFLQWSAIAGRVEEFSMGSTIFFLAFNNGKLSVADLNGNLLYNASAPWPNMNEIGAIVWAQIKNTIYIAYPSGAPNNVPIVLSWDGVSTWTRTPYAETVTNNQKRTPFYRISPQNINLQPSANTGAITLATSGNVFVAGQVGTRLQYANKQVLITGVSSPTLANATVEEPLPYAEFLTLGGTINGFFNAGDVMKGSISGAEGILIASGQQQTLNFSGAPVFSFGSFLTGQTSGATGVVTNSGPTSVVVNLCHLATFVNGETVNSLTASQAITTVSGTTVTSGIVVQVLPNASGDTIYFSGSDAIVGPSGSASSLTVVNATFPPQPIAVWDDEVINTYRGYPLSVFADQNRLGFTNVPALPGAVIWSAIGLPNDLYTGALPDNSIFEIAPDNSQVFYVIPGMESSEFVFADRAVYYIPITPTVPLVPGGVAFNKLSDFGCFPNVQPRRAEQTIVYMKAGGNTVGAVQAPGAYYRPYVIDNISEIHSHLFVGLVPVAIAIPSGPTQFAEHYIYIAMSNGTIVTGRYVMRQGLLEPGPEGKPAIGWLPWNSVGTVVWIAARQSDMIFSTIYPPGGGPGSIVERLDDTQYLDGAIFVNNLPPSFTPPGGKGPLYVYPGPNSSVFLIDQGTRTMGTYNVDANGFIIPQFIGGENLASSQLVAGQAWTATLEPFTPEAQPGQSVHQRMMKRRISRMAVYVSNGTGYLMARLFSGPLTPTSPALGSIVNTHRVETWNQGDNATLPPPLREEAQRWRPLGRAFDPRVAVIKDTPGPLMINEFGIEVTI
jgi:hypothetical protein